VCGRDFFHFILSRSIFVGLSVSVVLCYSANQLYDFLTGSYLVDMITIVDFIVYRN